MLVRADDVDPALSELAPTRGLVRDDARRHRPNIAGPPRPLVFTVRERQGLRPRFDKSDFDFDFDIDIDIDFDFDFDLGRPSACSVRRRASVRWRAWDGPSRRPGGARSRSIGAEPRPACIAGAGAEFVRAIAAEAAAMGPGLDGTHDLTSQRVHERRHRVGAEATCRPRRTRIAFVDCRRRHGREGTGVGRRVGHRRGVCVGALAGIATCVTVLNDGDVTWGTPNANKPSDARREASAESEGPSKHPPLWPENPDAVGTNERAAPPRAHSEQSQIGAPSPSPKTSPHKQLVPPQPADCSGSVAVHPFG